MPALHLIATESGARRRSRLRIIDTGVVGGIIVSPLGLQEGAEKIAAAEGIVSVLLDENSTRTHYVMSFLHSVMVGVSDTVTITDTLEIVMKDRDGKVIQAVKSQR